MPGADQKAFKALPAKGAPMAAPAPSPAPTPVATSAATPAAETGAAAADPKSPVGQALDAARAKRLDAQWTCKVSTLNTAQPLDPKASVGTKFALACEGPTAPTMDLKKLHLELPEAQKYALHVLETRGLNETRGDFVATSWVAGDIKIENPVLTDGQTRISLGTIEFKIATVVDPKASPTPFGPYAPLKMPLPLWIFIVGGILVMSVIIAISIRLGRNIRRKSLLRLLDKNPIALTPFHQLNKDLRQLTRTIPNEVSNWDRDASSQYVKQLDENFKWFVSRELILPALERSAKDLASDIATAVADHWPKREADHFRRDLRVTLGELEKARRLSLDTTGKSGFLSIEDAQQLTELVRTLADRIHEAVTPVTSSKLGAR